MRLSPELAFAQAKQPPKAAAPAGNEIRYFTAIDGLMDGNADVILKETRQGKTVTAATLDVCYPVDKGADRKDRFVVNLTVNGQNLTGSDAKPRRQAAGHGQTRAQADRRHLRIPRPDHASAQKVNEVASTDNSDLSEKEFQDSQTRDDGITAAPKDFTDVSPESVGVRVKLDAALDFLKSLKGEDVEVAREQPRGLLRRTARRRADHQPHRRSRARRRR